MLFGSYEIFVVLFSLRDSSMYRRESMRIFLRMTWRDVNMLLQLNGFVECCNLTVMSFPCEIYAFQPNEITRFLPEISS